jgi:transposase
MNSKNFETWLRQQLIPYLPPHSVLVLDNASYHNVVDEKEPCSNTRKAVRVDWLHKKNIDFDTGLTKPELYEIIKKYRNMSPDYRIDKILGEHGHEIVRLPPYRPEFNPVEKIFLGGCRKNWVATNNVTFKLNDVEALARRNFAELAPEVWVNTCNSVKKIEEAFIQKQHMLEEALDTLCFSVNTGSSDEEYDSDVSGIFPLDEAR